MPGRDVPPGPESARVRVAETKGENVMRQRIVAGAITAVLSCPAVVAADREEMHRELEALQQKVRELERRIENEENEEKAGAATEQTAAEDEIDIGGALRFQLQRRGGDPNDRATGGEIDIDTFRLNFDGTISDILFSAEYRFYPTFDNAHFIHHGWLGYDFSDHWRGHLGIMQVPFGIQPYASHNFFFSSNYYLGLEDDYDAGVNFRYRRDGHNLQLAFFKNDEYAGGGGFKRYSYDPLNAVYRGTVAGEAVAEKVAIEEANTANIRYVHTFGEGTERSSEIGLSLQGGQIYNGLTQDTDGDHWAGATHLDGNYGPWNLMLQVARYEIDADLPETKAFTDELGNTGQIAHDDGLIGSGAYAFEYTMPAQAWSYLLNVAYTQGVSIGPITQLTYYNDFTYVDKDDNRLEETIQNVTGMSILAGAFFTYVDFVLGKNQPFTNTYVTSGGLGGAQMTDLGSDTANDWNTRFNINVGYYF